MTILITGGAGYIGTHTCVALLSEGYDIVVVDNFVNSNKDAVEGVRAISGKDFPFYELDVRDEPALDAVFKKHSIDCVIHFAGLKAVGESVKIPWNYYDNNLNSTLVLCAVMQDNNVHRIVFSSSATVYDATSPMPLKESDPLGRCTNPYGWTKFMCEQILRDLSHANPSFSAVLLRYFNPVGAHPSGIIGENPAGIPNNLMPFISQTAVGMHPQLTVHGNDYPTKDGTGVRDYIHVVDLADGHVKAVDFALRNAGCEAFNLGTGNGISVLEMAETFRRVNAVDFPQHIGPRRAGDAPVTYADPAKAAKILRFEAQLGLDDMCRDTYRYQTQGTK